MMEEICAICGGKREEHNAFRAHVFTTKAGDLRTPEQEARSKPVEKVQQIMMPGNEPVAARLTEVLLEKGLLNVHEALYIAGVGDKPSSTPASGFIDPARGMGS